MDGPDDFDPAAVMDGHPNIQFEDDELHPPPQPRTEDLYVEEQVRGGRSYGPANTILDNIRINDTFAEERKHNLYYPFASNADWQVASWLSRLNVPLELLDEFFRLDYVRL